MASETIGDLYLRLGLSYDELNQDFVAAEETLSANIQRLNRESRLIKLKAEIDLTGVTEAAEKLKIQQEALTRQIEIQTQKVKLYQSEWISAAQANGNASQQAQKAAESLRRQELALAKLQQQLQAVNAQQEELAKSSAGTKGSSLLDRYNNIKGDISGSIGKLTGTFNDLREASGSAGSALTKAVELISGIPSPAGKAVAALAAIPLVIKGVENSILSVTEKAMGAGDSFYVFSRGLQVSIDEAKELSMICKVTGIEISEVAATTRRVATSFTKAGDKANLMTRTLQKYGVELKNSNGELKNTLEMSKALAEGLQKAQAEGLGKEFIASVFGRFASADYITYLEDLAGNIEFAKKVIKNGLEDPALAHSVQGEMNALNAQLDEVGNAFSYALLPVANKIIPELREQFGALTKVIADNAEGIRDMGYALGEVVSGISALTTEIVKLGAKAATVFAPTGPKKEKYDILERYKNDTSIKSFNDLLEKELARKSKAERTLLEASEIQYAGYVGFLRSVYPEIEKMHAGITAEASKSWAKFRRATDQILSTEKIEEHLERAKKYADELAHVKIDLQFGSDSYGKTLAELDLWYQQALEKAGDFLQERNALTELYNAKRELVERKHAEELAKAQEAALKRTQELIRDAADREYGLTHDAFEKQLYDIERWRQAQLEKAQTAEEVAATIADAAMKEAEAFKNATDQMESAVRRMQDDMARKTMSPMEYDYYRAQQQYNDYRKTLPKSVADEWFQFEMARLGKKTAEEDERYRRAQAAEDERVRQAQARGYDAERRTIENPYTKSPGLGTSPLVNADARAVAAMGVLEKYGISAEELQRELNNSATAQEAQRNVLQRLTEKMKEASGKLGDATTGAVDGVSGLGDAASEGAEKIASAAETVRLAFKYWADIEEENARRAREFQPPKDKSKIPITYGNEDDGYYIPSDKRIPITYGDEEDIPFSTFEEPMQTAAEVVQDFSDKLSNTPIENFQQEVQQATGSVTNNATATEKLADAATTAGTSTNAFSERLNQTADALDALREKIANTPIQQPPQQPQQYDNFSDLIDDALKATATIGELTELGGLATLQPEIALLGAGIEALANTAQTLREIAKDVPAQPTPTPTPTPPQPQPQPQPNSPAISVDLSEIQQTLTGISQTLNTVAQAPQVDLTPLQEELQQLSPALAEINTSIQGMSAELSTRLAEVAQAVSTMAQSFSDSQNRQPPQVNVTVNPNINLGGAYVFDNAMKQQLTDDIATEVADAVTSAVQTATNQANYGYGN